MTLSVLMMMYNHEKFIAQALDSVLMQKVNFEYEIVIGEDFSQDNTRRIVVKYQSEYPDKFKLLLHNKNIGAKNNQIACMKACTGKYIAMLEGDDFWTVTDKLQKQVDFLEKNLSYTFCFHKALILYSEKESNAQSDDYHLEKKTFSFEDYLNGFYSHTGTIVMRNDQLAFNPIYRGVLPARDNTIQILLAEKGDSHYIDETMSCYRVHADGSWTSLSEIKRLKEGINFKAALLGYYSPTRYKSVLIDTFFDSTVYALKRFIANKRFDLFFEYFLLVIIHSVRNRGFSRLLIRMAKRGVSYFKAVPRALLC